MLLLVWCMRCVVPNWHRKTTVFVQSAETAVELSQTFAAERYVPLDVLRYSADVGEGCAPSSNYRTSPVRASTMSVSWRLHTNRTC